MPTAQGIAFLSVSWSRVGNTFPTVVVPVSAHSSVFVTVLRSTHRHTCHPQGFCVVSSRNRPCHLSRAGRLNKNCRSDGDIDGSTTRGKGFGQRPSPNHGRNHDGEDRRVKLARVDVLWRQQLEEDERLRRQLLEDTRRDARGRVASRQRRQQAAHNLPRQRWIGKVVASDVDDVLYQDEVGLEEHAVRPGLRLLPGWL